MEKKSGNEVQENQLNPATELKCGIIMPISAIQECTKQHWEDVKCIIEEAILDAGYAPNLVSDASDSGIIQSRIVQNIYDNEMVVCDVSCKNPNVMFELGLRLAFDKPAIIIIDDQTSYSFDTAPIEHLSYPRDLNYHAINAFKKDLMKKIKATQEAYASDQANTFLKHFGEFRVAKIEHKEGSAEDVILNKLDKLETQIRNINTIAQRPAKNEQIRQIVNDAIIDYCKDRDVDYGDLMLAEEGAPILRELYDFLESKQYIRRVCGSPQTLYKTINELRGYSQY